MTDPHAVSAPVLDALAPADRSGLLRQGLARSTDPKRLLFLAGDRARRLHLVRAGYLKLVTRAPNGQETIISFAVPGAIVGAVGILDGLPQPYDAVAITRVESLVIEADRFLDALHRSPEATLELAREQAAQIRWLCDGALDRSHGDAAVRLAGRLLDLADLIGRVESGAVELRVPIRQDDLGRLSGMCRESACKALRGLRKAGAVDYRGRTLRIVRPDVLEKIRCGGLGARPSR